MNVDIDIDEDAYNFACAYARGKGLEMETAISELLLQTKQLLQSKQKVDLS